MRDSDGTVVFTLASKVTGGSLRTIALAAKHRKPCLHIALGGAVLIFDPVEQLRRFVAGHGIRVLNVAGSRESKEPGLHDAVMNVLRRRSSPADDRPAQRGSGSSSPFSTRSATILQPRVTSSAGKVAVSRSARSPAPG